MRRSKTVLLAFGGASLAWALAQFAAHGRARRDAARRSLTTVPTVVRTAFMGLWRELYRIPNRFEPEDCVEVLAEYGMERDGSIRVENTCVRSDGTRKSALGKAWITEPETGSKLEVGFFHIGSWYPRIARGDYWILDIGPKDFDNRHSYVVVGEPKRRYGWILAREKQLSAEVLDGIFARLETKGYARERFVPTGRSAGARAA